MKEVLAALSQEVQETEEIPSFWQMTPSQRSFRAFFFFSFWKLILFRLLQYGEYPRSTFQEGGFALDFYREE